MKYQPSLLTRYSRHTITAKHYSYIAKQPDNSSKTMDSKESIADFYSNSHVLITGGLGFIGKALVEKLLRSCDSVNTVYLLARSKRGVAVEDRLKEVLENPIFRKLKLEKPEALQKIKIVNGDFSKTDLGMSESDKELLKEKVNIVLHSAATVRFNETLKFALQLNTIGTKALLDIFSDAMNFKRFVHISTAYANSMQLDVKEEVYDPPYDIAAIIDFVTKFPDKIVETLTPALMHGYMNTYCLTKGLAENIVKSYSEKIPTTIIRPSIVSSTYQEPFPGWTDNLNAGSSIAFEIGRGLLRSYPLEGSCNADYIPVDTVAKAIIACAWHSSKYPSSFCPVYSCTSGEMNEFLCRDLIDSAVYAGKLVPTKDLCWYPNHSYNVGPIKRKFLLYCIERPIVIYNDCLEILRGRNPRFLKISKKCEIMGDKVGFIFTNNITFNSKRFLEMAQDVKSNRMNTDFDFDISPSSGFNWNRYFKHIFESVRYYMLGEDIHNEDNRQLLNRYYWVDFGIKSTTLLFIIAGISNILFYS